MSDAKTYEFDDVRIDLGRMTLSKTDALVEVEPKTFDVLLVLLEHRDRLVTKEELLDAVWKDTFVTPNVLTRAVAQIRKALGDDARDPRYIETVATRGYRFIAPVTEVAADRPAPQMTAAPPSAGETPTRIPSRRLPLRWLLVAAGLLLLPVAAAILYSWKGMTRDARASAPAAIPEVQRVLGNNAGYDGEPSFSPDGQSVAYVSDKTGPLEIYVAGLAPGSREIAVTSDGAQNHQPAWSPDGQWIAYQSQVRGGIWIIPSTGGAARQVIEFGSQPAWSPDSQQLALASDAGSQVTSSTIWIVKRDGSDRREVTHAGNPNGGHHNPSWSHDGQLLTFVLADPEIRTSLWITSLADEHVTRLSISGEFGFQFPRFAPDDHALYWAALTTNANPRLWRAPLTTDTHQLASPPQPVLAFEGRLDGFSVARDGRVVYGPYIEDSNLWSVAMRGPVAASEAVRLTRTQRSFRANYSTDHRVAYERVDTGSPPSTWIMNEDGTEQQPLANDGIVTMPQWTGDGSRVMAVQVDADGHNHLVWVDPVTRRLTAIPLDIHDATEPRISPDGTQLAFHIVQPGGTVQVWTQPIAGGSRKQVTADQSGASYPNWSRDGKWLAVEITRGTGTQIGVVSRDGGHLEQLTDDPGDHWPFSWSPDNEWIVYASQRGSVWNIWTISRRTKEQHQITQYQSSSGYVRWPAWSPRADRIIFERDIYNGEIWLSKLP